MPKQMPKPSAAGGSKTPEEIAAEELEQQQEELAARRSGKDIVVVRTVRDTGMSSMTFPILTRSNYHDWSLLMRVILQARGLWTAVETGVAEFTEDRMALEAILRAVPPEMLATLAVKKTAKEAWDTIKILRIGAERVRESRAQTLRLNYEEIKFKPGETIDDFSMRLQGLINELEVLGDPIDEKKVVLKLLRIVPKRYKQLAWSIESLVDLSTLSIEDLVGRLKVVDEREGDEEIESGVKLLLTEDQWLARMRQRERDGYFGSSGSSSANNRRRGRGRSRAQDGQSSDGGTTGATRDDKCRYCGKPGHWARDCWKKKRDEVHLAQVEDEEPALLMAQVTSLSLVAEQEQNTPAHVGEFIHLNEKLIGYDAESKAYRVYDPANRRVCVTRDTVFDEAACWDWGSADAVAATFTVDYTVPELTVAGGSNGQDHGEAIGDTVAPVHGGAASPAVSEPVTPRARVAEPTTPLSVHAPSTPEPDPVEFVSPPLDVTPTAEIGYNEGPRRYQAVRNVYATTVEYTANPEELYLGDGEEPVTFADAEPHKAWRAAMMEETAAIEENHTWTLTELPAGKRPIGLKKNSSGEVVKHRARHRRHPKQLN